MSSSPFEIFRRNLKPLMVFLTLLALFSFVVLPALDTYMRRGGGMGSDPVAATFDGTQLTRAQVARTTQNHAAVVRFLSELAGETMRRGGVPQTPGFQFDEQSGQIQALGIDANPGEEATINTLRFYSEARKAGFELDDTAIRNWLMRFTDATVSDSEIVALMMRSSGNQLGQQHLYEQLRMHLLADLYQRGFMAGLTNNQMPVVTPLGQWENFLKINQKATVQAYGVLVSEYIDQTDDNPASTAIQEVYEDGRNRLNYPNNDSPLPSFRRPDSAHIEYVAADLQKFVELEKAKISEEQIRAEYERRLAGGDFQLPDDAPEQPASPEQPAAPESAETAPASEAEAADPETADPEASEPAAEDSSMSRRGDTAVQLVVFQDEEAASGDEQPDAPEAPAEPDTPAKEDAPADTDTPSEPSEGEPAADMKEEQPAEPQPAADEAKPAADEAKPAAETAEEPAPAAQPMDAAEPETTAPDAAADTPAEAATMSLELDDEPAPTKPQSFEEVRDQIATELASEPARQALDRAVTEATKRMRRYFSELAVHESNVDVGVQTKADAPKRLDLKAMASELGLVYGKSEELVNRVSVEEIAAGKSYGLGSGFNRRGPPYGAMMFGARMQDGSELPPQPVFSPLRSVDLEAGVTYISWKTEDVAAYTPKLDEVRDEVVQFIRTREARELAKAAAQEIAAKLEGDSQALADAIPADKAANLIESAGPFSWLEQVGFMETVASEVPELDAVGEEFMRAVFSTEVGSYAVAPNDPQTVYYVVKPVELQPSVEQLREQFRQPQQRFMAMLLGNQEARNILRGLYEAVDERTGFELKLGDGN